MKPSYFLSAFLFTQESLGLRRIFLKKRDPTQTSSINTDAAESEVDTEMDDSDFDADSASCDTYPKCSPQITALFNSKSESKAGSVQPAGGSNPEAIEATCQSEKHPYKCMQLGAESGCAWSMHPDCGPAVGSCVSWASGGGGAPGVDTTFASCSDWKTFQQEQGKVGVCPSDKEDIQNMVDKLYCGKGLPKEFVEERKKAEDPAKCKDGDVGISKNSPLKGGVELWPEVFHGGKFHPICGHFFWDNNRGANMFCKKMGFAHGGRQHRRNKFKVDSMPVGKCGKKAEKRGDLRKCNAGGNAWGNFGYRRGWCKAGKKIGVSVICNGSPNKEGKRNSCK